MADYKQYMGMRLDGRPSDRLDLRTRLSPAIANNIDEVASSAEKVAEGRTYRTLNDTELEEIRKYLNE